MSTFLSLPDEVLLKVLGELSVVEVLSCTEVCKRLQWLVQCSCELQYRIDLFAVGSVEIPGNGLILAERASVLRSHVDSWESLAVKRQEKIHFSQGYRSLWAYSVVSGGVFAGVGSQSLAVAKLPSTREVGGEVNMLQHGTLFVDVLFVNPQEDALVMVHTMFGQPCLGLVFWTLDGLPHPSAVGGRIEYRQELADRHSPLKLLASDITRDYVGVLVESLIGMKPVREIVIWRWCTGEVVSRFRPIKKHYTSFDFLSETEFMVCNASSNPMTIDVYTINTHEQRLECLHSLQFPVLAPRAVCHLSVIPNRSPRAVPRAKSSAQATSTRLPFVTRSELRVICIRLRVVSAAQHMSTASYLVFIPAYALLRTRRNPLADPGPPVVPWTEWGPDSSRWFDYSWTGARVRGAPAVHGTRAAITVPSEYMGSLSYRFLDFNPLSLKRAMRQPEYRSHRIVSSPSVMEADGFWTEYVESCLPYRELSKTQTFNDLVSLFLDDERIIAMKSIEVDRSFLDVYVL